MTLKEKLIDALRFGPMTQVMRGWDEQQRMWLCAAIADDLIRDGWTSTNPVSLADGSDTTQPSGKWPSTTGSTDDR